MDTNDKKLFEDTWGFAFDDVVDQTVGYTFETWFEHLEKSIEQALKQKTFARSSEKEKAKFGCLAYMACVTTAQEQDPRDLQEKTYPQFQVAMVELQKHFYPFGLMLGALNKRYFREAMAHNKTNVEALKERKQIFKKIYESSFVPKWAQKADLEISWDLA